MSGWLDSVVKVLNTPIEWPSSSPEAETKEKGGVAQLPKQAQKAMADMEAMDSKGMLPKFFRHWKNPAFLKQLRVIVARMQADGVNIKDKDAIQAWLKNHEAEIKSGNFAEAAPAGSKPQTFVKTGPDIGRNDPCICGSGKKYKKCCGAKA